MQPVRYGACGAVVVVVVVDEVAVVGVVVDELVVVELGVVVWVRVVAVAPLLTVAPTERCVPGTCVDPSVSRTRFGWLGSACALTSHARSMRVKMARLM